MSATTHSSEPEEEEEAAWPQVPKLEPHHFMTEPMESERHLLAMLLLYELVCKALSGRGDIFVGADLAVYFSDLQVKNKDFRAPDLFVALGVDAHERDGWVVWREGGKYPELVVELMSPSTRKTDLGVKRQIYGAIWQVREYVAFDLDSHELFVFHRGQGGLEPAPADDSGRVWSDVLGAAFGLSAASWRDREGPWLRLFDKSGALLPTDGEIVEAETARAEAEKARAEAEKARADAAEAELAALRAQLRG